MHSKSLQWRKESAEAIHAVQNAHFEVDLRKTSSVLVAKRILDSDAEAGYAKGDDHHRKRQTSGDKDVAECLDERSNSE